MSYIQTAFGGKYRPGQPDPDSISIKDIAHALSNLCRFTGHTAQFYSVAQHSVLIARELRNEGRDPMTIRAGLMHDAHEAYVGDLSSPVKDVLRDLAFSPFDEVEARAALAVAHRFALPRTLPDLVKEADLRMLVTEAGQLLNGGMIGNGWPDLEPYDIKISPWLPERARIAFLDEARRCDIF